MRIPKKLKKYALWMCLTIAPYPYYVGIINTEILDRTPKIQTTEEAYNILEEEKANLGIRDKFILQISEGDELHRIGARGFCGVNEDGYVIGSNKSDLSRLLLRHELYHYFRAGGCAYKVGKTIEDSIQIKGAARENLPIWHIGPKLIFYYVDEPRAVIYSITGLKL